MNELNIYIFLVTAFSLADILAQKNSKSLVSSKSKDRTYLPVLLTFMLALFAVPFEYMHFRRPLNHALFWLGAGLGVAAAAIRVKGQLDLRYGFSTRIEKQAGHELVTTGLYGLVRHPLYLALLLLLAGAGIMFSARYSWLLVMLSAYTLKVRIDKEEAFLAQNFPEYPDYMNRTKKLIPFVW